MEKEITEQLYDVIYSNSKDKTQQLLNYGRDFGFMNADIRRQAYMNILKITEDEVEKVSFELAKFVPEKKDDTLLNDSNRSFIGFSELQGFSTENIKMLREDLSNMLHFFFHKHPELSYYQGFNNFAELFLMIYGKALGYLFLERWAHRYLAAYLSHDYFGSEISKIIGRTQKVLEKEVPTFKLMFEVEGTEEQQAGIMKSRLSFVVSWIVTWFSYRTHNLTIIYRIFDYIVCSSFEYEQSYVISIITSLIVRNVVLIHGMSLKDERTYEERMLVLYNCSLDSVDWKRVIEESKVLCRMDEYKSLTYSNKNKLMNKMAFQWDKAKQNFNGLELKNKSENFFKSEKASKPQVQKPQQQQADNLKRTISAPAENGSNGHEALNENAIKTNANDKTTGQTMPTNTIPPQKAKTGGFFRGFAELFKKK